MTPQIYIMQPFVRGDVWSGIPTITILVNGAVPPLPIASARMQFRRSGIVGDELLSLDGSIIIQSAANWELSIPSRSLSLSVGKWDYDLETTDSAGVIKTYIKGSIAVANDITR